MYRRVGRAGIPPLAGRHMMVCSYRWYKMSAQALILKRDGSFFYILCENSPTTVSAVQRERNIYEIL